MRIRNIILAGAGLAWGMTIPALASSGVNRDAQAGDPPPPAMGYDDDVTMGSAPPPPSPPPPPISRQEGSVERRGGPGVDYDAPPYAAAPRPATPLRASRLPSPGQPSAPGQPVVTTTQAPGRFANGYYYPGVTTTTVVIQPAMQTTRTYVTETVTSRPGRRQMRSK
ncbi:hypothetical protein CAF53_13925 [Sphingobium sp. LB126]|uniref:hypothetical protein n=1 Tax=Sphingobium sp. LB126 TaxID=1983755 RepID=UPI000C202A7C|nr:hypothetical protein [Sphingobium sp. LB126]PJG49195.1 hypothetical protein CAF53_13925 [Sphingobium sp. LB126]